jgi:deoxycytidylate deaminase
MLATFHGHTDAVAALIVAGADIIATDDRGYGRYRQAICVRSRKRKRKRKRNGQANCGEYCRSVRQV